MDRKKFLARMIGLIFFIFLLNYLAMKFYWYSSIWYFDILMHFLGGFWLGMALFWLLKEEKKSFWLVFKIVFSILAVGLLWEMFEVAVDRIITQNIFNFLDTASDIFFDLAGGLSAILFLSRKIAPSDKIAYN